MPTEVYVQNWEESERGWGARPDGFTVHVTREQRDEYVRWYNEYVNDGDEVPDEYTRPDGEPFLVKVSPELFDKISAHLQVNRSLHGKLTYWHRHFAGLTEGELAL